MNPTYYPVFSDATVGEVEAVIKKLLPDDNMEVMDLLGNDDENAKVVMYFLGEDVKNAELLSLGTLALSKVLDVNSEYHESQKLIADELIDVFDKFYDDKSRSRFFDQLGIFSEADMGRLMDINAHTTQITKDFGNFLKAIDGVDEKQARKEFVEIFR